MSRPQIAFIVLSQLLLTGRSSGNEEILATCTIHPQSGIGNVYGNISLKQSGSSVILNVSLAGFPVTNETSKHGFHVHTSGNLSDKCNACLGHFNPLEVAHGNINDSSRHVGDLGNVEVQANGTLNAVISDNIISLHSSSNNSVVGRSIVVHASEDDLGRGNHPSSNKTGNSGGRLGCCTINLIGSSSSDDC